MPVGPEGRVVTGVVKNGDYTIDELAGITKGKHHIAILGYKNIRESVEADLGPEVTHIIPSRCNTATNLEVKIGGSENNVHDFNRVKQRCRLLTKRAS